MCNETPVQGPLAVGDLNGTSAGVPPDEIVTSEGGALMGIFGFAPPVPPNTPMTWSDSTRNVPGDPPGAPGLESAAHGRPGQRLRPRCGGRPAHQQPGMLGRTRSTTSSGTRPAAAASSRLPHALPSTPGVDAVAVDDVDADGCNDVVAAGTYGTGMVHLGNAAGGFDGGQDLPQLGYQNPATATRVALAVGDLTGDGRPEIVISDANAHAVMVYRNTSTTAGSACGSTPPTAVNDVAVVVEDAGATPIDVLANDTDPDGGPKSVIAVTQAAHGSVEDRRVGVTYKPGSGLLQQSWWGSGQLHLHAQRRRCCHGHRHRPVRDRSSASAATSAAASTHLHRAGHHAAHRRDSGRRRAGGHQRPGVLSGRAGNDCLFGLGERRPADRRDRGRLFNACGGDDRMKGDAGADKFRGGNGNDVHHSGRRPGHGQCPRRQ